MKRNAEDADSSRMKKILNGTFILFIRVPIRVLRVPTRKLEWKFPLNLGGFVPILLEHAGVTQW